MRVNPWRTRSSYCLQKPTFRDNKCNTWPGGWCCLATRQTGGAYRSTSNKWQQKSANNQFDRACCLVIKGKQHVYPCYRKFLDSKHYQLIIRISSVPKELAHKVKILMVHTQQHIFLMDNGVHEKQSKFKRQMISHPRWKPTTSKSTMSGLALDLPGSCTYRYHRCPAVSKQMGWQTVLRILYSL